MRTIDHLGTCGMHIDNFCDLLLSQREKWGEDVSGEFNGVTVIAHGNSTRESLVKFFHDEFNRKKKEYQATDEYKEKEERNRQEVLAMSNELKLKTDNLSTLDFSDLEAVLDWCCEVQPLSDRVGVNVPKEDILRIFAEKGFVPNMNLKGDFREDDKENVAKYIIGQALSGIEHIGAMHHMVIVFTERWKEKFTKLN